MQTKIIGGGAVNPGAEWAVDPTFQAARVSIRPLDYAQFGQILGHYRVSFNVAAALWSANAIFAAFRWTDATRFMVLNRLSLGLSVVTAVTAQRTDPIVATVVRAYTTFDTTNATNITLSGSNQKARTNMGSSLMGNMASASAAAGLSAGVGTADANPMSSLAVTGLGALGTGQLTDDLIRYDQLTMHPQVFSQNEGVRLAWGATALATGSVEINVIMGWSEVVVF